MKIGKVVESGFYYGVFTATAIAIPAIIMGAVYGCAKVIHKIKERHEYNKTHVMLNSNDYKSI